MLNSKSPKCNACLTCIKSEITNPKSEITNIWTLAIFYSPISVIIKSIRSSALSSAMS
jgi:hypothetical protein